MSGLRFSIETIDEKYRPPGIGGAFQKFVFDTLRQRFPNLQQYDSQGRDGAIDLFSDDDDKKRTVIECRHCGQDGYGEISKIWRVIRNHLEVNLADPGGPGQSQYQPWYSTTRPICRYIFTTSGSLPNAYATDRLRHDIENFFVELGTKYPHLAHLKGVEVEILDWQFLLGHTHPDIKMRWFPQEYPTGLHALREFEKETLAFQTGRRFRVALSFAGAKRDFVGQVANLLADELGKKAVLYDKFYQAEFARADLGTYLPKLFRDDSDLIVAVFCNDYQTKPWTGLEWEVILDRIHQGHYANILLARYDNVSMTDLESTAGFIELDGMTPEDFTEIILERLNATLQSLAVEVLSDRQTEEDYPSSKAISPDENKIDAYVLPVLTLAASMLFLFLIIVIPALSPTASRGPVYLWTFADSLLLGFLAFEGSKRWWSGTSLRGLWPRGLVAAAVFGITMVAWVYYVRWSEPFLGFVADSSSELKRIENAHVTLYSGEVPLPKQISGTDENGMFRIDDLRDADSIRIVANGYEDLNRKLQGVLSKSIFLLQPVDNSGGKDGDRIKPNAKYITLGTSEWKLSPERLWVAKFVFPKALRDFASYKIRVSKTTKLDVSVRVVRSGYAILRKGGAVGFMQENSGDDPPEIRVQYVTPISNDDAQEDLKGIKIEITFNGI